jgi:hypothetical protein
MVPQVVPFFGTVQFSEKLSARYSYRLWPCHGMLELQPSLTSVVFLLLCLLRAKISAHELL